MILNSHSYSILNSMTYRTVKTALSKIPGAPGSAQLGEAIAAGWEFQDYHDLKRYLDAVEVRIDYLPLAEEVYPPRLMRCMMGFGVGLATARDCATTMMLVNDTAGLPLLMEGHPAIHQGTAFRLDVTASRWQDAVHSKAVLLFKHAPGRSWSISLDGIPRDGWRYITEETHNYPDSVRVIHAGTRDPVELDAVDYDLTNLAAAADGGSLPITLFESALNQGAPYLPLGARTATIEPDGIFVSYELFEICLARFPDPVTGEFKPRNRVLG